jgi:hypothetical protein
VSWPAPRVGQIIRYAYLWKSEADEGLEEGLKDRPAVIVIAQRREGDEVRVVVAPITHTAPREPDSAIEVPTATCRRVGLDDERQWIVLGELNSFLWPGPDLRPVQGEGPESVIIGVLPAALSTLINERLQARITARRVAITTRTGTE